MANTRSVKNVQQRGDASERQYRAFFDSSGDALMLYRANRLVDCNPVAVRMFGAARQHDLLGATFAELSVPLQECGTKSVRLARERFTSVLQHGTDRFEWAYRRIDGTSFAAEVVLNPLVLDGRQMLQASVREITVRKSAEEALRRSRDRFRRMATAVTDLIYEWDVVTGRLLWLGDIDGALGYAPGEIPRTLAGWREVVHPDDHEAIAAAIARHGSSLKPLTVVYRVRTKNGEHRYFEDRRIAVLDESGTLAGVTGACSDVTDRRRVEQQAKESEKRFLDFLYMSDDPILLMDGDVFIDCNEATARMLDYPCRNALLMARPTDLSPVMQPDGRRSSEKTTEMLRLAFEKGGHRFEWTHLKAGGESIVMEVTLTPIAYHGKTILHCHWRDLTEQMRAKEEREQTRRTTETILESIPFGVLIIGKDKTIRHANSTAIAMMGYDSHDVLLGLECHQRLCPAQRGACPVLDLGQQVDNSERILIDKDKNNIPILKTVVPITLNGEEVLLETFVDITHRKAAELQLRKLTGAIEQNPTAVVITDFDGNIEYVNPGFTRTTGYSSEEVIGESLQRLQGNDRLAEGEAQMWDVLRRGEVWRGEMCHRRKNGELYWEDVTTAPVQSDDGTITNFVSVMVDVSQRKQAAEALRKAKEEAETASRAKSQFLASVSHELRTPLNGVIGMTELLRNTPLDEHQVRFVDACQYSGKALLQLINQILDFSKIEAGKLDLELHEFCLEQIVEETIVTLACSAEKKGLELYTKIAPNSSGWVRGDSTRLRQVLVNLVGNAIKFTERGHISVRIESLYGVSGKQTMRCEVSDTGIGIPPERIARLFEPFTQADASTTRKYGGTGLGLAISKSLVELMGGQLQATSEIGCGSTFWFTIPLTHVNSTVVNQVEQAALDARDQRGLLMLANPTLRDHLSEMLGDWHVAVKSTGPDDVLETLRTFGTEKRFDFVITDLQVVPKDRLAQFAKDIRGKEATESTKLIVVACVDRIPPKEHWEQLGVDRFISKPICQSTLLQAISECSSGDGGTQSSTTAPTDLAHRQVPLTGIHVLLAEDNYVNQLFVGELLRYAEMTFHTVGDGLQALDVLQGERFDLVLMDCQMPRCDGFEVTRRIRAMEQRGERDGHLPIIALTANAVEGDRQRCLQAGMDDYLAKPFESWELFEKIDLLLDVGTDSELPSSEPMPETVARQDLQSPLARIGGPGSGTHVADGITNESPIASDLLLSRCMGNLEFATRLLDDFETDLPAQVRQVVTQAEEGNVAAIVASAHLLKGAAGTVTAEPLHALAAEIEAFGKAANLPAVQSLLGQLQAEAERCLEFVTELRSERSAPLTVSLKSEESQG